MKRLGIVLAIITALALFPAAVELLTAWRPLAWTLGAALIGAVVMALPGLVEDM